MLDFLNTYRRIQYKYFFETAVLKLVASAQDIKRIGDSILCDKTIYTVDKKTAKLCKFDISLPNDYKHVVIDLSISVYNPRIRFSLSQKRF